MYLSHTHTHTHTHIYLQLRTRLLILEKGGQRKRERNINVRRKHGWTVSHTHPNRETNLQPWHVLWQGVKPRTFWFMGWHQPTEPHQPEPLHHILTRSTTKYLSVSHANNNSFIKPHTHIYYKRHAMYSYMENSYHFTNIYVDFKSNCVREDDWLWELKAHSKCNHIWH